ncbi:MAG: UPF0175 family protein [Kiritimatiellae bacterium]|nr:UPF0175 family protein [Kiritimatiellia bacterium]
MQNATIHVKVESGLAKGLKQLARSRQTTMGQLVREALVACYQPALLGLSSERAQALAAYRGGYITVGKLAEVMGMHVLTMRQWLNEHGIPQNNALGRDDQRHAL